VDGLESVWEGLDGRVYAVPETLPRAYVVATCEQVGTPLAALRRFVAPEFPAGRTVVLERSFVHGRFQCAGGFGDRIGSAEIVRRSLNSLLVRIDAERAGWLVVDESWDPGWSATVDGHDVEVLPGNYAFRAVHVPGGRHDVRFVYRPALFEVGAGLSAASLAVTVGGLGLLPLLRRRRLRR
jgi:hypothetical protein